MKSLSLAILLLSFSAWATAQTVSIQGSGEQADTSLDIGGGHIFLFVANGTDANSNPVTLLAFDAVTANPDGTATDVGGFGLIPQGAFQVQGPSKMNLSIDTSQISGFANTTCIISSSGTTCSDSQGGLVQAAWTGNGIGSLAETFHLTTTTGSVTQKFDDHGTSDSANAQGTILGLAFSDTGSGFNSFVSSIHTHNITISRN